MNFYLASGNLHKAEEFAQLINTENIQVISSPKKVDVIEDGATFQENAYKKALGYFEELNHPVLSDDSGLVVNALPGELGVLTARFGGDGLTDEQRAKKLLQRMEGLKERSAYFVCVLCFYISSEEIFFFEGRLKGSIGLEYRGELGFGYDPVFIPKDGEDKATLAMIPDWKKINSHRAKACQAAQTFFKDHLSLNK